MQNKETFLRLAQIVGNPKRGIEPLIHVSGATWWRWVKSGRAPQPIRPSPRCTVWRKSDIDSMLSNLEG